MLSLVGVFLLLVPGILVVIDFLYYIVTARRLRITKLMRVIEVWAVVVIPVFFLSTSDYGQKNDCCSDSAVFSPEHRKGMYFLIILCMAAYFYTGYRKRIAPPLAEVLVNSLLLLGLAINILLCVHLNTQELGAALWLIGNIPIILLFILMLARNQELLRQHLLHDAPEPQSPAAQAAWQILQAKPFVKFPVLLLLALPILLALSLVLLVFGQKPDTLVRAFTDTYKHGLSQLDYMCDNVACGGHYLCSVAANGHKPLVKPIRLGERNGHPIICNRQLLVANAFEELIQNKAPALHRIIRNRYDKIGDFVQRYYAVFTNKYFSDCIYVCMKPLEWAFLFVLYLFDRKPENRIAKQYLNKTDRLMLTLPSPLP